MKSFSKKARALATRAHDGQLYGTGDPYIMHPTQTAELARRLGYHDDVVAVCFLHDVVEDTTVTLQELGDLFPDHIVSAVAAVTFTGKGHKGKIAQAKRDPIGHVVKFCDVSCNYANAVLYGVKPGQTHREVILRRASYLEELRAGMPTPKEIETYIVKQSETPRLAP